MGKYVLGMLFLLGCVSCGKDVDVFVPRTTPDTSGNVTLLEHKLRNDLSSELEYSFVCSCYGDRAIEIGEDLVIVIPPWFVDLTEFPCTTGSFRVDVTVCDSKGDMMIAGIPTIADNQLLHSRIAFNIRIMDGDKQIRLGQGKQIRILVNDPDPQDRMELFYGADDQWVQADGNPDTWDNVRIREWWIQPDSMQEPIEGFGYEAFSDSTDWINVDVFVGVPQNEKTTVCVTLPEEFTNTNTAVFMAFDQYNSILQMQGNPETKQFCEPYGATPVGFDVTFVVMSEKGNGQHFFSAKKAVIGANHHQHITPLKTPYSEILSYISQL